jgi:acyl dehydratase
VPINPRAASELPFDPITVDVERGRLRLFAKAIGETDPLYTEVAAAEQAGHPDLPVPPTFFFSLELEQSFTYHRLAHAGDTLTLRPRIVDVYSKKSGALEFLVKQTSISRGEELVAEARSVLVVRNPETTK